MLSAQGRVASTLPASLFVFVALVSFSNGVELGFKFLQASQEIHDSNATESSSVVVGKRGSLQQVSSGLPKKKKSSSRGIVRVPKDISEDLEEDIEEEEEDVDSEDQLFQHGLLEVNASASKDGRLWDGRLVEHRRRYPCLPDVWSDWTNCWTAQTLFAFGDTGTESCDSAGPPFYGYKTISNEATCQSGAAQKYLEDYAGRTTGTSKDTYWEGTLDTGRKGNGEKAFNHEKSQHPSGCFFKEGKVYYNKDQAGIPSGREKMLCVKAQKEKTCGSCEMQRSRIIDARRRNPCAEHNGIQYGERDEELCTCGQTIKETSTFTFPPPFECCPTNCEWSPWTPLPACPVTCGTGVISTFRHMVTQMQCGGSIDCEEKDLTYIEYPCETIPCPIDCSYGEWGEWTDCDKSCNTGTKHRARTYIDTAEANGKACAAFHEGAPCNGHSCPIDCELSAWNEWRECSVACGGGEKWRNKTIISPNLFGGALCPPVDENRTCGTKPCAGKNAGKRAAFPPIFILGTILVFLIMVETK